MAASKQERDVRLQALKTATVEWAARRTRYLNDQVTFARRILRGRTGAERLTSKAIGLASNLVVDEINQFMTG
jgi:hypothetical protein